MLKKLRVSYWMLIGFVKKHTKLLLLGIIFGILGFIFIPKIYKYLPTPIEKIGVVGKPTLSEIPLFIQKQISMGLTEISPQGEAIPAAATSYQVYDDSRRYVFSLRDDLIWQDGKKLSAEDVSYTFSDVKMTVTSSYEITFELKEPFSPFPTIVSQPIFRQDKQTLFASGNKLIGLGSFKVLKIKRNGSNITELYLKSESKRIIYRFYNTQETAILAFKLGEIDKIVEITSPRDLANWPNTVVKENIHFTRYVAVFFNTEDGLLSSKGIRQALTYAISAKTNDNTRALSPINPNSWAYNPQVKRYDYDLEAAKRLLSKELEENKDLKLKIVLTTTLPHLDTAEKIIKDWRDLGFETTIKVLTYIPQDAQSLLIAQEIPPDPDQYSFWHSIQPANITNYNSPKVDKLLEDGRQITEKKDRITIYHDFQRFLVEDTPAAFLFHHKTYTVSRS